MHRDTKKRLRLIPLCGLLLFYIASTAAAGKKQGVMPLYNMVLHFPLPNWNILSSSGPPFKIKRAESEGEFKIEMVPSNQAFKSWSTLFGVYAVKQSKMPLSAFVNRSFFPYGLICGVQNLQIHPIFKTPTTSLYTIYCMSSPRPSKLTGYGKDVGEIGVFRFFKVSGMLVKVYEEWRGPRYEFEDPTKWPVSPQVLSQRIDAFRMIRLLPAVKTPSN